MEAIDLKFKVIDERLRRCNRKYTGYSYILKMVKNHLIEFKGFERTAGDAKNEKTKKLKFVLLTY